MNLRTMTDQEVRDAWWAAYQRQSLEKDIMLKSQRDQWLGLCATHKAEIAPVTDEMRRRELFRSLGKTAQEARDGETD